MLFRSSASAGRAATNPRAGAFEDRDWHASSRDLAHGLIVQEVNEATQAELSQAGGPRTTHHGVPAGKQVTQEGKTNVEHQ